MVITPAGHSSSLNPLKRLGDHRLLLTSSLVQKLDKTTISNAILQGLCNRQEATQHTHDYHWASFALRWLQNPSCRWRPDKGFDPSVELAAPAEDDSCPTRHACTCVGASGALDLQGVYHDPGRAAVSTLVRPRLLIRPEAYQTLHAIQSACKKCRVQAQQPAPLGWLSCVWQHTAPPALGATQSFRAIDSPSRLLNYPCSLAQQLAALDHCALPAFSNCAVAGSGRSCHRPPPWSQHLLLSHECVVAAAHHAIEHPSWSPCFWCG